MALIRNQRKGNFPDPVAFALECEKFGADGVTVHPRPDERHVRYSDLPVLKEKVTTELNIEGFPSDRFVDIILDIVPDQCTLVPDGPDVLTSDQGWDVSKNLDFLTPIVGALKAKGIRVSIFLDPDPDQLEAVAKVGADRVELYTGDYAKTFVSDKMKSIQAHKNFSHIASKLGVGLNAGHDLNLDNLKYYNDNVAALLEVSIGHAFVSDCLYMGLEQTMKAYKSCLNNIES